MHEEELVLKAAKLLYDRKAEEISVLKVSHLTILCDYMLIATGRTANQVTALADAVDDLISAGGLRLRRSEGRSEGRWAVLDYGTVMVHLFHRDERSYYSLDRLWNDGTNLIELPFNQSEAD